MRTDLAKSALFGISLLAALAVGFAVRVLSAPTQTVAAPSPTTVQVIKLPPATRTIVVGEPELSQMESTLYLHPYTVEEGGRCKLPGHVRWDVLPRYNGRGDGVEIIDERITVVLSDAPNHFWPVIVKMPVPEAEKLQKALAKTIADKKKRAKVAHPE
jgi:hypothetical protein